MIENFQEMIRLEKNQFISSESTSYLLSNDTQFRYIDEIIYHLIYISISMADFKCNVL